MSTAPASALAAIGLVVLGLLLATSLLSAYNSTVERLGSVYAASYRLLVLGLIAECVDQLLSTPTGRAETIAVAKHPLMLRISHDTLVLKSFPGTNTTIPLQDLRDLIANYTQPYLATRPVVSISVDAEKPSRTLVVECWATGSPPTIHITIRLGPTQPGG